MCDIKSVARFCKTRDLLAHILAERNVWPSQPLRERKKID